ncbi:septal ring lytic transglycosylase RlpA family protein [Mongoliimonas terrestris]|uniref:septal ring lytic transglycosylase RlpA family protein n=1 Tax=Mongoliimonas terrestris TaxID=1709001 RepID=UPI0009497418|nr:septal ring lytic transglycosylase RlpA family protein [Mongoliimonas terrestris]
MSSKPAKPQIDPKYGVAASPRVYQPGQTPPKGGGREMVGKPYTVAGKRYVPRVDPDYEKVGLASWYGDAFHGRYTANGEIYDADHLSAAHPTMPLPSYARVTSMTTGRSVMVRVNDRGPFHGNRVLDVSRRTAEMLGIRRAGIAKVKVEYVGPAPKDGDDTRMLLASYQGPKDFGPVGMPETMVASADTGSSFGLPGLASRVASRLTSGTATAAKSTAKPAAPAAPAVSAPTYPVIAAIAPTPRPVLADEAYIVVASVDPADVWSTAAPVQVASLQAPAQTAPGLSAAASVGFTEASFSVGAQPAAYQPTPAAFDPTDALTAPVPEAAPARSSYAAERVDQAYAAVDAVGSGVALSDLASGLARLSNKTATSAGGAAAQGALVDVGIFSNPANAERIAAALRGVGTVTVEDVVVSGAAMKRVRIAALVEGLSPLEAVAAAERAGARGARVIGR